MDSLFDSGDSSIYKMSWFERGVYKSDFGWLGYICLCSSISCKKDAFYVAFCVFDFYQFDVWESEDY